MVRTQIQLKEEQYRVLRKWAAKLGISLSEAIRRCVTEQLGREQKAPTRDEVISRALSVCGKYQDPAGRSNVAQDHDHYLDEAYR